MERASWPFRLWGVRHIRAAWYTYQIVKHYDFYLSLGMLPVRRAEDMKIVEKIRNGEL